jgi:hypothetical protein
VNVASPVVMGTALVPVDVTSICWPLLSVVRMVVVNGWRDVETRALVRTMAVERGVVVVGAGASLDAGGAFPPALLRCVGVVCGRWLVSGAGPGEDCAGWFVGAGSGCVSGAVVGSFGLVVGAGVGVGLGVVAGGAEDAGGAGVGELLLLLLPLPVPEACRFSPWCRYASTPSMCRPSPRLKADDSDVSAKMAVNHEVGNMFGAVWCGWWSEGGSERM